MPRVAKELKAQVVADLTTPGVHLVGGVAGLGLQVTEGGARSWLLRATVGTNRKELGLGAYPEVTLALARKKATEARELIRSGIDPLARSREARSRLKADAAKALSFSQVAAAYIAAHESGWRNAKHGQQWRNSLERLAFPVIGDLLVKDVEKEHVLQVLRPIWTTTTETATRLRSRIELVLSYAMQAGYRPEGLNPARWRGGLDKLLPAPGKITKVEHYAALQVGDMGAFMQRLRTAEGVGARALEFVILTAARSGEVRGATWAEIDLDAATWVVPEGRMKAEKEHRVPLSEEALALLAALPRMAGTDLVFPSSRGGKLSDMTLTSVLRRMQVPATTHGFRSSFRDWAAERTNYPREAAEMALAHTIDDKVEAAYRRGDLFEKRRTMMAEWAQFVAVPEVKAKVMVIQRAQAK